MGRICDNSSFCYSSESHEQRDSHLDEQLIADLHDAPGKLVMACTGGGSDAIARLLAVPGASRTLLEATVPYHPNALAAYIGGHPDHACSGKTARALAMAAFQRARQYDPACRPLLGVGCTAALTTDRVRRGEDRCHVAVQSIQETIEYSFELSRTNRDRETQEAACSQLVLTAIARILGLGAAMPVLFDDESLTRVDATAKPEWQDLFTGEIRCTGHRLETPLLVFPGAFNPVHSGHRKMAEIASEVAGMPVLLEISAFNVDKPPLDYVEMHAREDGVEGEFEFTFSNAPTFLEKSALFPGATFIVGSDTLERIAAPRYYHDSESLRDQAITTLASRNVRFLVFGRTTGDRFRGLDDIEIPGSLRDLCSDIPEHRFRDDISSSEIRRGN